MTSLKRSLDSVTAEVAPKKRRRLRGTPQSELLTLEIRELRSLLQESREKIILLETEVAKKNEELQDKNQIIKSGRRLILQLKSRENELSTQIDIPRYIESF